MKNVKNILPLLIGMSLFACSCSSEVTQTDDVIVMIGNKAYKHVSITVNGTTMETLVPRDSSVRIIPVNTTHEVITGKYIHQEHAIIVD